MYYYPSNWKRFVYEATESLDDDFDHLLDDYIEEHRYDYREEWFELMDALDKE